VSSKDETISDDEVLLVWKQLIDKHRESVGVNIVVCFESARRCIVNSNDLSLPNALSSETKLRLIIAKTPHTL